MKNLQYELNFTSIISEHDYYHFFRKKAPNNLKVVDLFCGCGGFSLGFQREGFEIIAGVDFDKDSLKTYQKNLNADGLNLDLSEKQWLTKFQKIISESAIDILIGGPPCQGFSLTGTRVFDDPRNKLYKSFFECIDLLNPRIVLIENVKGMSTLYKGEAKRLILEELEKREYFTTLRILNSADYGVPQFRERLFIFGIKSNTKPYFPEAVLNKDSYITSRMAISDLPTLEKNLGSEKMKYEKDSENFFQRMMREESEIIFNHVATNHKDFVIETIKQVPDGGNYKDLPKGIGESRKFNEAWTRYDSLRPSKTIDTGHRNHFHYELNRVPTVRENARLQSFPDNFVFFGSKTSQNRQVGNAVPVLLSQALAANIITQLKF